MTAIVLIYAGIVFGLLMAELRENRAAQIFFKPLAALGFIVIALRCGALDSLYGQVILAGLVACGLGDVLLLSRKSKTYFLLGMAAFALGHLAYLSAFMTVQTSLINATSMIVASVAIFGGLGFFMWLKPCLPTDMRLAVRIYTILIIVMVIRAFGLPLDGTLRFAPVAAVMFAVSDMFVARDRFVTRDPKNALAITPLYFGAQALFALSTQV